MTDPYDLTQVDASAVPASAIPSAPTPGGADFAAPVMGLGGQEGVDAASTLAEAYVKAAASVSEDFAKAATFVELYFGRAYAAPIITNALQYKLQQTPGTLKRIGEAIQASALKELWNKVSLNMGGK
jgi:hypothetical protein